MCSAHFRNVVSLCILLHNLYIDLLIVYLSGMQLYRMCNRKYIVEIVNLCIDCITKCVNGNYCIARNVDGE